MAFAFSHDDPVLNFGPRGHVRPTRREYLLWPAWAYRVVAPRVRRRPLNVFQRAVLGLYRAGVQGEKEVGSKLAIEPDLAAFITDELRNLGFLDLDDVVTKRGLEVLSDDELEDSEMVAGYVFQDPWNGELWPRFTESLKYCDVEYNDKGYPRLAFGTAGRPWSRSAWMVFANDAPSVSRPTPAAVVAAVSGHRKGLRYAAEQPEWQDEVERGDFVPSDANIRRVSFIEERPIPVFLTTYIYRVPKSADWFASDPFGMGASVRLRRRIEQIMPTNPVLFERVNRLLGREIDEGLDAHRERMETIRAQAELQVEHRLSLNIRAHSAYQDIVNMEFGRLEVDGLGESCPAQKIHSTLRSCSQVMEALFAEVAKSNPLGDVWKQVYVPRVDRRTGKKYLAQETDKQVLAATYGAAARETGFDE
ncbi:MAG: hypothetical protein R6V07_01920, partial [Armatimonadota bacterium]